MFNESTYYGTDGVLTLNVAEGEPGASTVTDYFGESGQVGRLKNVSVYVTMEVKAFHELGSRAPKELRAGNIHIGGTVERAYINGALLKLMLGDYAENEETAGFKVPSFTMKVELDNLTPTNEKGNNILEVRDVYFDTWQFNLPEDDFVLEKLSFKARRVIVKDESI